VPDSPPELAPYRWQTGSPAVPRKQPRRSLTALVERELDRRSGSGRSPRERLAAGLVTILLDAVETPTRHTSALAIEALKRVYPVPKTAPLVDVTVTATAPPLTPPDLSQVIDVLASVGKSAPEPSDNQPEDL
jgi:hypothetical protein